MPRRKALPSCPIASRTVHPGDLDYTKHKDMRCAVCGCPLIRAVFTQHGYLGLDCYLHARGLSKPGRGVAEKVSAFAAHFRGKEGRWCRPLRVSVSRYTRGVVDHATVDIACEHPVPGGRTHVGVVDSMEVPPKQAAVAAALLAAELGVPVEEERKENPTKEVAQEYLLKKGTLLYHGTPYSGIRMLQEVSWLAFDKVTAAGWADPKEWIEYSEPVRPRVLVFEMKKDLRLPIVGEETMYSGQVHLLAEDMCVSSPGWVNPPGIDSGEVMLCSPRKWLRYLRTEKVI